MRSTGTKSLHAAVTLTHCARGLVTAYGNTWTEIWVNIASGNGLLPDGTKPLPEPMLADHQWSPVTSVLWQFHKICLKITHLKFHSNFPGTNELTHCPQGNVTVTLEWMLEDLLVCKSTLVQVMVCCHQATSHYLNHCWQRSLTPYGITRPQWVNSLALGICELIQHEYR